MKNEVHIIDTVALYMVSVLVKKIFGKEIQCSNVRSSLGNVKDMNNLGKCMHTFLKFLFKKGIVSLLKLVTFFSTYFCFICLSYMEFVLYNILNTDELYEPYTNKEWMTFYSAWLFHWCLPLFCIAWYISRLCDF